MGEVLTDISKVLSDNQTPKCCRTVRVPFHSAALHLQDSVTFLLRLLHKLLMWVTALGLYRQRFFLISI